MHLQNNYIFYKFCQFSIFNAYLPPKRMSKRPNLKKSILYYNESKQPTAEKKKQMIMLLHATFTFKYFAHFIRVPKQNKKK